MILVSFDIDGTMEFGDPPGPLTVDLVRRAKDLGYVVGSASDRIRSDQANLWKAHEVEVDFVMHKHHLTELFERFSCTRHVHIGDTHVDEHYAKLAGFEFHYVTDVPAEGTAGWIF
ncbi:MAG: HAD family hydrolase [Acidimicrobiia bacterium]